jgi:cyclophilin family peptidyl-prolyl cis-trans isomerase
MKRLINYTFAFLTLSTFCLSCTNTSETSTATAEIPTQVEIVTNYGTILIELYDATPLHRDNFITLVKEGTIDSTLFHRVIENFMIQGGDPDSRTASATDTLGNGGLDYKVPAEFDTALFHKKGVLGAARDGNPERASSSTQFYIVQGRVLNDSLIDVNEVRINGWLAEYYTKQDPVYKPLLDSLELASENDDYERYVALNDSLSAIAKSYSNFEQYQIPEAHREVYRTIGGTPHLDQNYTVFGEVIAGLNIVDSIAAVPTSSLDRPMVDVRILSIRILE